MNGVNQACRYGGDINLPLPGRKPGARALKAQSNISGHETDDDLDGVAKEILEQLVEAVVGIAGDEL